MIHRVGTREEFEERLGKKQPTVSQTWRSVPVTTRGKVELKVVLIQEYTVVRGKTEYRFTEMLYPNKKGEVDMTKALRAPLTLETLANRVTVLEEQVARLQGQRR